MVFKRRNKGDHPRLRRSLDLLILFLVLSLVIRFVIPGRTDSSRVVSSDALELEIQDMNSLKRDVNDDLLAAQERDALALLQEPDNVELRCRHARLCYFSFHRREAQSEARKILAQVSSPIPVDLLLIASGAQNVFKLQPLIENHSLAFGMQRAQVLIKEHQYKEAIDYLKNILTQEPGLNFARGRLGVALAHLHSPEFLSWNESLPAETDELAEVWHARAIAASKVGLNEIAAVCAFHALALEPLNYSIARQLKKLIHQGAKISVPNKVMQRLSYLSKIEKHLTEIDRTYDPVVAEQLVELFLKVNEPLLAMKWAQRAMADGRRNKSLVRIVNEFQTFKEIASNKNLFERSITDLQLRKLPIFVFSNEKWFQELFIDKGALAESSSHIHLQDVAANVGLVVSFDNGSSGDRTIQHLFETTGGGMGVLDFDCDGWPDLYFAQGGDWRSEDTNEEQTNSLWRNLSGNQYRNVTRPAGLDSFEYSQGICIGDYNSDGFPDIYVCQLGENRLYENLGDGTFRDASAFSRTQGNEWSLSAGFADLNNDGLSDLYVVNYLRKEAVRQLVCQTRNRERSCPPKQFSGVPDRIYLNLGDGRFRDISSVSDRLRKGMGVSIADVEGDGSLEIFVGNDGQPNDFYEIETKAGQATPVFKEVGMLKGVALSHRGDLQATMGIATADFNGDELIDFAVSNFYEETNTLYLLNQAGTFTDQTSVAGSLHEQTYYTLGFGNQAIDVDLDGDQDLFIANGHIDETSVTGEPDQMRPQLFLNDGAAHFELFHRPEVSNYFQTPVYGRAVASLDWNRDGRSDLCVTHLDRSAALLENKTITDAHFILLRLVGTNGERSAGGASVFVTANGHRWRQTVINGDGYLVSNEKKLHFGLGDVSNIDEIEIQWRSGANHIFTDVALKTEYLAIEGQPELFALPVKSR